MRINRVFVVLFFFLGMVSCGEYHKVYKSKDSSAKYTMAMKKYKEKDYSRAVQLFEQLRDIYRRTDSLENVYYHIAMSYYHLKDYSYASLFFKDYTDNFTNNARVIECSYMAIYCDYMLIGDHDLDQSETRNVMEAMQTFVNYYPDSEYTEKCNALIDEMRGKLQKKEYEIAVQYYKMGEFKSTVTATKTTIKLYPDIPQREELEFLAVKAQYQYAMKSIESKRMSRLEEVITLFEDYRYNNDVNSKHYAEALELKTNSENEIKKLKEIL